MCEFQALLLNQFMTLNDIHIIGPTFFYGTYKDVGHKVVRRKSWIFLCSSCCGLGVWFVTVKIYAYEGFYFTLNDFYAQTFFLVCFLFHTLNKKTSCAEKTFVWCHWPDKFNWMINKNAIIIISIAFSGALFILETTF